MDRQISTDEKPMSGSLRQCGTLVIVALLAAGAFAQAPPTDDTYSKISNKTQKNGSANLVAVQPGVTGYVKFNLGTLPANPAIAKATLRLYVDAVASPGSFDVYGRRREPALDLLPGKSRKSDRRTLAGSEERLPAHLGSASLRCVLAPRPFPRHRSTKVARFCGGTARSPASSGHSTHAGAA
jgi:hypothetical protein